jgi:hypothetical protein
MISGALALWLLHVTPALAHPLLDQARQQADRAEFERALLTLSKAESEAVLTRDDVVQLYLQRALIHFALRVPAAMAADLELVATLEPALSLDASLPPDVREAFPRRARRLQLEVEASSEPDNVHLRLQVAGLRTDLVKAVKLTGRAEHGEWSSADAPQLRIEADPGTTVEYYAVAYGPGGSELATLGSWSAPEQVTPAPLSTRIVEVERDDGDGALVWWVAGGLTLVAAVTAGVLLATQTQETRLSAPTVQR